MTPPSLFRVFLFRAFVILFQNIRPSDRTNVLSNSYASRQMKAVAHKNRATRQPQLMPAVLGASGAGDASTAPCGACWLFAERVAAGFVTSSASEPAPAGKRQVKRE
jgi:hypothetical protein